MTRAAFLRTWPLLLAAATLLAACAQPVPRDFGEYVGHWRGDGVRLVITADGTGDYEQVNASGRFSVRGPVHGFVADGFRIGIGPLSVGFEVQQRPHLRDGRWRMKIDGRELTRVDILPIPGPEPAPDDGAIRI
jgi:hypothetical protein